MRKSFLIVLALAAVLSCTENSRRPLEPSVPDLGTCIMRVRMDDPSFSWDAVHSKIGVYSDSGENVPYSLRSIYNGSNDVVEFFGPAAKGTIHAYYPYSRDGYASCLEDRVSIPSEQKWYSSSEAALAANMPYMVATDEDGIMVFRQTCGLLHVSVKVDFPENITSLTLSGNGLEGVISMVGIDRPSSVAAPLDVWFVLGEGSYDGFILSVSGLDESITAIMEGEYEIVASAQTDAEAREKYHDYDGGDFTGEEVEFD